MVASKDIRFYVHTNTNAPQLTNNFGCMIDVLDACLVNGFSPQTVSTLTASGTTVTATFGSAHNFMQYQVIKIAGATQTEYNGEHRILTVPNANSITFQLAAAPSVTTATGTITCSLPPLGWEKPFSSSNPNGGGRAAYRSKNTLLPSRPFLRVVDELDPAYTATYAKFAKVGIVEDMTDIDTMLGVQAPYDSAVPTKNWVGTGSGTSAINGWAKWYYAGSAENYFNDNTAVPAGNRNWVLVGNGDYFYLFVGMVAANTNLIPYGFGTFKSLVNTDTSNTFLSATISAVAASTGIFHADSVALGTTAAASKLTLLRNYAQTAQYMSANCMSMTMGNATIYSGYMNYIGAYTLTNIAPFIPVFINETVLRGELYGLYWLLQNKPYSHLQLIVNGNAIYIATNICMSTNNLGQIVVKVGEI